jgi:hypothetical protein
MTTTDLGTRWERPSAYTVFMCGVMTGVGLGILIASARGRDTRHEITSSVRTGRERASRLVERTRHAVRRRREHAGALADRARTHGTVVRTEAADIVHEARSAFERARHGTGGSE